MKLILLNFLWNLTNLLNNIAILRAQIFRWSKAFSKKIISKKIKR